MSAGRTAALLDGSPVDDMIIALGAALACAPGNRDEYIAKMDAAAKRIREAIDNGEIVEGKSQKIH